MNVAFVGWHVPAAYELALRSNNWHYVEHICFFVPALSLWWTVLQPWPSKPLWTRWMIPIYLAAADIVNTGVSASLAFEDHPAYPTYINAPHIFGINAMTDQMIAGSGMWVIASLISLIPLSMTVLELLTPKRQHQPAYSFPDPEQPAEGPRGGRAVRSAAHARPRQAAAVALWEACAAGDESAGNHARHRPRPLGNAPDLDESRWRDGVEHLSPAEPAAVYLCRKPLLHGVPVHPAARAREVPRRCAVSLALVAEE